jgi:hypothetical protein
MIDAMRRAALALIFVLTPMGLAAQEQPPANPRALSVRFIPAESTAAAPGVAMQAGRSRWIEGAVAGAVIGGGATWLIVNSGDSTALCDRDRNQDAIGASECAAIVAAGAVVGAGIGALIGSRIRPALRRHSPVDDLRMGLAPAGGVSVGVRMQPRSRRP